jgi:hypothetical protein
MSATPTPTPTPATSPAPSPAISPDVVTTRQLLGSFTAKHWKVTILTVFSVLSAFATGGFWVATRIAEAKAEATAAKAELTLAQKEALLSAAQTDVKLAKDRIQHLTDVNAAWARYDQTTSAELTRQRQEIVSLSAALGKANNCTFIHEQIAALQRQIQSTGSTLLFNDTDAWRQQQSDRKQALDAQLAGFTLQLGNCNK